MYCEVLFIINPRRACAARVTCPSVRLSVCLSVCYHVFGYHAQQTGKIATPALHWLDFKNGDFRKSYSEVMASEQANMLAYLDLIRVPRRHKKSQRKACIDSRMLSTTVASPCLTLRGLLAEDHE